MTTDAPTPKRFTVVTILPELIEPALTAGVVGRAKEAGTIIVDTVNPRDFTHDKHRTVDDTPYGGGPGMVMKAEPLIAAIAAASAPRAPTAASGSIGKEALALGKRMLRSVESTLTKLAGPKPTQVDDGAHSGAAAESAVDEAEALIAEMEAQLRGDVPAARSGAAGTPKSAGTGAAGTPAAGATSGAAKAQTVRKPDEDNLAAAATLADLELELGMRQPAADLYVGGARSEAKVLGPAYDDEPSPGPFPSPDPGPGPNAGPVPPPKPSPIPIPLPSPSPSPSPTPIGAVSSGAAPASTSPASTSAASTAAAADSGTGVAAETKRAHRILMSPSGAPLTQARVRELALYDHLVLVCGRYEGIDQRVIDTAIDEELSIGDYVLSGGELAVLVVIDAVARLVPGVLGDTTSADDESFSAGLLEYPQYTRPPMLDQAAVPPVLQSGNHALIASWRRQQSLERTAKRRPDLFRNVRTTKADNKLYAPLRARTHIALVHHPVVDRVGDVITTAVTNFDIHDIARSSMTYGLANYHLVTPVTSQREKAHHIAQLWMGDEQGEHRASALRLVRTAASVDDVIASITESSGKPPLVVATSAKPTSFPAAARRTTSELVAEATLDPAPVLLLLGTGWGLADSLIPSVSRVLAPIEGDTNWNHLSVRSAAAIILDRLFGRPA